MSDGDVTRRDLMKGAAAGAALVSTQGTLSTSSDVLSPTIENSMGMFNGVPDATVTYGSSARPSFIVEVEEADDLSTLQDWAKDADTREYRSKLTDKKALVSAPKSHVLGGFGGSTLADLTYISHLDLNLQVSLVEPLTDLPKSDEFRKSAGQKLVETLSSGKFMAEGVAYDDDTSAAPLSNARSVIGDGSSLNEGLNSTVAVLDTGCNRHSDLHGTRITHAKNFISGESVDTDATSPDWSIIEDGNGHGSWCCSAVGANASDDNYDGVATSVNLAVGKVMSDDGEGTTADIVAAMKWARDNEVDAISMSLGSPLYSETLADEVEKCAEADIPVALAAGNSRHRPERRFVASPADTASDASITVASTTHDDAKTAKTSYFSCVGPDRGAQSEGVTAGQMPDIGAPGHKVTAQVSTVDGALITETLSGTSMATPMVAGALALLSTDGVDTIEDYRTRLLDHTRPMSEAGVTEVGHGMLAVDRALNETEPDEPQDEIRDDDALSRDKGNRAYSTSFLTRYVN